MLIKSSTLCWWLSFFILKVSPLCWVCSLYIKSHLPYNSKSRVISPWCLIKSHLPLILNQELSSLCWGCTTLTTESFTFTIFVPCTAVSLSQGQGGVNQLGMAILVTIINKIKCTIFTSILNNGFTIKVKRAVAHYWYSVSPFQQNFWKLVFYRHRLKHVKSTG